MRSGHEGGSGEAGSSKSGLIRKRDVGRTPGWLFLVALGPAIAIVVLAVDDLLLGHERIYPRWFGLDERGVFVIYMLLVAAYVLVFNEVILRVGPHLLVLSLSSFAAGLVVDVLYSKGEELQRIVEDGPKFVGIATGTTFHLWAVWRLATEGIDVARLSAHTPMTD